jgi:hypothetical protein
MGTRSFPGVESGWGVTLDPSPLLVPRSKNRVDLYSSYRPSWPVKRVKLNRKYNDSQISIICIYSAIWRSLHGHRTCKCVNHNSVHITNTTSTAVNNTCQIFPLLACYTVLIGSYSPTFRDSQSVSSSGVKYLGLFDPTVWPMQMVPKRRLITTNQHFITCQKSEDLTYSAAEKYNHTIRKVFLETQK